jgi:hypothetical protein
MHGFLFTNARQNVCTHGKQQGGSIVKQVLQLKVSVMTCKILMPAPGV